jgi:hypothetical protein
MHQQLVFTGDYCNEDVSHRWSVYADSAAETLVRRKQKDPHHPSDIVFANVSEAAFAPADGVHDCGLYGEPAKLYYWHPRLDPRYPKGLVCLVSDAKAREYAQRKLDEKSFL